MKSIRTWVTLLALGVLALGTAYTLAQSLSGEAEVRINARRLDDGRTEFALQQRTDGEWGERILPDRRLFPADPGRNRWLNSSPLTIETIQAASDGGDASVEALAAAEARLAELEAPIYRVEGTRGYGDGRITVTVQQVGGDHNGISMGITSSTLLVQQEGEFTLDEVPLQLEFGCYDGFHSYVRNVPIAPIPSERSWGHYTTSYQFFPAPERGPNRVSKSEWAVYDWLSDESTGLYTTTVYFPSLWYTALRQAESVEIMIEGADGKSVSATFSMDGVWDTPVTPNLDRCGTYW